jgi:hypothetical protein
LVSLSVLSARPVPCHPVVDDDELELDELEAKQITCESPVIGLDTSGRDRFGENSWERREVNSRCKRTK